MTALIACTAGDLLQFGQAGLTADGTLFTPSIYIEQRVFDYANLSELNNLTDVLISSEQTGDILGWNGANSKY